MENQATVKPVLSRHLKIDKTKVVMENESLTLKAPITTAADNKFSIFEKIKYDMSRESSREISCLVVWPMLFSLIFADV